MSVREPWFAAAPGSNEAISAGCICAVMDNGHGRGYLGGMKNPDTGETMYVVTVGCPVHPPRSGSEDSQFRTDPA